MCVTGDASGSRPRAPCEVFFAAFAAFFDRRGTTLALVPEIKVITKRVESTKKAVQFIATHRLRSSYVGVKLR